MNVAKNWALTIMLIALAFAHFSSELLLKEFSANFDFFPRKSREIGRFFREFAPENPAKSANFSANLPLKIPRNFAFFFAKYQKPCYFGLTGLLVILCVWSPLFLLSKLLAMQDNAQNLEEQLWMEGRREVNFILHRCVTSRFFVGVSQHFCNWL